MSTPEANGQATLAEITDRINDARSRGESLTVRGGNSKAFLADGDDGAILSTRAHSGIVSYAATELVITARAGTPLADIEAALEEHAQVLGCEPPRCAPDSTLGGVVASGFSGPARPFRGSLRDHVLGIELVTAAGERLRFGGQVMKNVAGYDVSRLMAGSFGALGVITEVSMRVMPAAAYTSTLSWSTTPAAAITRMAALQREPWPLSGLAYANGRLLARMSGSKQALDDAIKRLAPEQTADEPEFWTALRDWRLPALAATDPAPLWRLSVPPATPLDEDVLPVTLMDWGGAVRWIRADVSAERVHAFCSRVGGHATCLRAGDGQLRGADSPLAAGNRALMRRVRDALDPGHLFDAGRYCAWARS